MFHRLIRWSCWAVLVAAGCKAPPHESKSVWHAPLIPTAIAVTPALNFSGSRNFDPLSVASIMAGELDSLEGVDVIPLSRVLAVLAEEGRTEIESAEHARRIGRRLGADAVLVFAVTTYEPYDPPIVGIAAQLVGTEPAGAEAPMGPPMASGGVDESAGRTPGAQGTPWSECQRVFNAAHQSVIDELKTFAKPRQAEDSPYGWRKYLVSQTEYVRFCCHQTVRALMDPRTRMVAQASASREVAGR